MEGLQRQLKSKDKELEKQRKLIEELKKKLKESDLQALRLIIN